MKFQRQAKLLEIIENECIETQEELSRRLSDYGYEITQATISRDIKELRLTKVQAQDGRYRYAQAGSGEDAGLSARLRAIFRESVTSFDVAQHIVVLKTLPGLAPAACSALDSMKLAAVVGTLAGDDTAFLALRDADAARDFCEKIRDILK